MIGPYAVIEGETTIGARNRIFQFASIGPIRRISSIMASRRGSRLATTTVSANSPPFIAAPKAAGC